jgi:IclR family KDG regulon transcriptional repressor
MDNTKIQVINKALDIIEQLATSRDGLTLSEISTRTELPKSTVHRILSTFTVRHYVEKDEDTCVYSLGLKFVEIASIYLNKIDLKTEAAPIMHTLAASFNTTCYLGVLENNEVLYLEKIEKFNSLRLYTNIGKHEPVHCTALGKVLLASLPTEECDRIGESLTFSRLTPNTKMTYEDLKLDIEFARKNGFALDNGEHTAGSSCIAVPVYDYTRKVIAAMSLSGLGLLQQNKIETLFKQLQAGAIALSQRIGYPAT